ncbi:MAG TPA: ABC transporter permease [Candidatus Limnocylindria bacterium]|nr:ABC transporter permease [Candidatus Limnocylindria bacterium]
MVRFLVGRVAQMAVLFVVFLSIVWLMLQAMPGDISDTLVGNPDIPLATRFELRERLGLDQPLLNQYVTYITNFFRGEMGVSFSRFPQDVSTVLWQALPRTLVLFLSATLLAFWLGFKTGKLIAWRRGAIAEKSLIVSGVFLQTVFYPWFAIVMLWLFGFFLGWFPIGRFIDSNVWQGSPYDSNDIFFAMILSALVAVVLYTVARLVIKRIANNLVTQDRLTTIAGVITVGALVGFWYLRPEWPYVFDIARHTVLPVVTLALVAFGATMLLTRGSMLETLGEDYILTARAKGVPDRVIRDRHAARNALLPVTTSLVLALSFVIGGGIVTETIFSWPGMGLIFLQAINVSDIPLAVGALSITGVLALVGHLVADILYAVLDPRIRIA